MPSLRRESATASFTIRKLAGRYRLLNEIGRGGMGIVYAATDLLTSQPVAVKMLSAKMGDDLVALLRFKREARTASSLAHPNICRIEHIGEHRGFPFIVMELLEGETAGAWLGRGQREPARVLDVVRQAAEGLRAAHRSFIVHRDIKPANVFLTHTGVVKLLDFGLAKHFVYLDTTSSLTVTSPGTTPGTVSYMSPEQVYGQRLDQRSDLFALGIVLYEMLTGRTPFRRRSALETMSAIGNAPVPPLPAISHAAEWSQLLDRLLAKSPADRYRDAGALLADLGELGGVVEGSRRSLPRRRPPRVTAVLPCLAIMPFELASSEHEERSATDTQYFCLALFEELMAAFSHVRGLRLVPRTLASRSKKKRRPAGQIGRRMQADRVLSATFRGSDQLSAVVTLYGVPENAALWTRRYTAPAERLFQLRDEIARDVIESLHLPSPQMAKPRVDLAVRNRTAFHLCIKGRFHWSKRYEGGLLKAMECFTQALEIDPDLALAHAGLADTYSFLGFYSLLRPRDAFGAARTSVTRALALDNRLAEAHTSDGLIKLGGDWNWAGAAEAFRHAIALDPTQAPARLYLSWVLVLLGDIEEAHAEAERAQDTDPLSSILNAGAGYTFFLSREYERSVRECEKALEVDREFLVALYVMGMSKAQLGLLDDALAHMERAVELSGGEMPFYLGLLGKIYADLGLDDKVAQTIRRLEDLSAKRYVPPHCFVYIHAGRKDFDTAFAWQDRAFVDGASPFNYFSPVIERLHQDRRFKEDLRAWGLDV